MSEDIKSGDRVKFRAGRGYSEGRVANVADGIATIATSNGKNVNRRLSQLALATLPAEPPAVETGESVAY